MPAIIAIILLSTALSLGLFFKGKSSENKYDFSKKKNTFFIIAVIGFFVRIICALAYKGHETDMMCFGSWSDMIFKDGFSAFYASDAFTDYPPGYMYILYIIGFIKSIFAPSDFIANIILKLPAIICDILCGYVVYRLSQNSKFPWLKTVFAAFFIFNPAVILNSSIWGQVDSVFTLFVLLMLFELTQGKTILAYYLFGISLIIKPQALFYTPVLIYGIIEQIFLKDFSLKKFFKNLLHGFAAIVVVFILAMPFGIGNVIGQYAGTLNSYNYATVNAYNFWCAIGLNWTELTPLLSGIGIIFIIVIVAISAIIFFKEKPSGKYFYVSGFICFAVFMFSTKMHERYAFPAIALFLCGLALSCSKKHLFWFLWVSAFQLINTSHVLFFYDSNYFTPGYENIMKTTSWAGVIFFVVFLCTMFEKKSVYKPENAIYPITKKDIVLTSVITLVYSVIALYNLGDMSAPQTFESLENTTVSVELGEEVNVGSIKYYLGANPVDDNESITYTLLDKGGNAISNIIEEDIGVFTWQKKELFGENAKYLEIKADGVIDLCEVAVIDTNNNIVTPISQLKMFDEQYMVPDEISYRNSMYFDEIYHGRTAYEFIHKLPVYEWTHPPLGKIFISAGVNIFSMTPFGWRIVGTVFGILMIPLIYIFSKKLFGTTWISVCASLLFSYDFMHFAQSRIATIDVYVTFFIILMYLLMYMYYCNAKSASLKNHFVILGLCGISMGLGIACKWTGVYASAGLAILFFMAFFRNYKTNFLKNKNATNTIIFCLFAFVLVPIIIYVLSYIPYLRANGGGFGEIISNQISMFTYHGDTVVSSTHPFSSPWNQWLVNYRPIWYYTGENAQGLSENINSFGNPFVWIGGLLAFFYTLYNAIMYKDQKAQFLVIGYLAELLPWIFVTRITFIYHYFPSVPFLVLMLGYVAYRIKRPTFKYVFIAFTCISILAFIAFYPVLSGYPVDGDYVRNFLRWLPSWHLI